jgi:hypothetical protein
MPFHIVILMFLAGASIGKQSDNGTGPNWACLTQGPRIEFRNGVVYENYQGKGACEGELATGTEK